MDKHDVLTRLVLVSVSGHTFIGELTPTFFLPHSPYL